MAETYIPKQVIDGYKKLKKTYPDILKKLAASTKEEVTETIIGELDDLFKSFDKGLSAMMKSAKTTDSPEKAKKILESIIKVVDGYQTKTDKIEKWALKTRVKEVDKNTDVDLSEGDVKVAFKLVRVALSRIEEEATKGLNSIK